MADLQKCYYFQCFLISQAKYKTFSSFLYELIQQNYAELLIPGREDCSHNSGGHWSFFYVWEVQLAVLISSFNNYLIYQMQNGDPARNMLPLDVCIHKVQLPFNIMCSPSIKAFKYNREGHWNQKQKLQYAIFLRYFQKLLEDPVKRKVFKVFDMMSDMIMTRNSNQCRNHHEKMEKYRNNIPQIIKSVAEKYDPVIFQEITSRYSILIKTLLYNQEKYIRSSVPQQGPNKASIQLNNVQNSSSEPIHKEQSEQKIMIHAYNKHQQKSQNLLKKVTKSKLEFAKTKVSYHESNETYEKIDEEEIPFMRLNDIKSEENLDNCTQSQMIQNQEDSFNMVFHEENSIAREKRKKLAAIERRYYQSEMKKLELQRQRHDVNMRHFSSQVLKEKESILYCESAIKLLQMTIAMVEETMI